MAIGTYEQYKARLLSMKPNVYLNGKKVDVFPFTDVLDECKPVFETLKGWNTDISKCRKKEELPKEALEYIAFIEKACDCHIKYVSVGAERDAYIEM